MPRFEALEYHRAFGIGLFAPPARAIEVDLSTFNHTHGVVQLDSQGGSSTQGQERSFTDLACGHMQGLLRTAGPGRMGRRESHFPGIEAHQIEDPVLT